MPDEIHEDAESVPLPRNWHLLVRTRSTQCDRHRADRDAHASAKGRSRTVIRQTRESTNSNPKWRCCGKSCVSSVADAASSVPSATAVHRPGAMAILHLAMRGWNKSETSRHFLVSDDTIRDWLRRVDDAALVQTATPVNRFPDVVRCAAGTDQVFLPDARQADDRQSLRKREENSREETG